MKVENLVLRSEPFIVIALAPLILAATLLTDRSYVKADTSFASVYQNDRPSVVYIVCALADGAASGSGFIYSSTGSSTTIITANHVIEGASRIDVILDSDTRHRYAATVVKRDHIRDVAVLEIPVGNRKALALMDPKTIHEGADMVVIGYPRAVKAFQEAFGDDLRPSVHVGIISAIRLGGEIVQFDAQTDHGDSGGPLIDKSTGAVIGIVTGKLLDATYQAKGIQEALPGSGYGMSASTIEDVINGAATTATGAAQQTAASDSTVGKGDASSAAYRVGYGIPHYSDPAVEADAQAILQRLSNYFTNQNLFYMVPVKFGTISEEGQRLSGLCDDERLNAIVQPSASWSFPRYYTATGRPASIFIQLTLAVSDCSGGIVFSTTKQKSESTAFAHRSIDQEVVDMANDLLDQSLRAFDDFRNAHDGAWNSLLKTGIAIDPNDDRFHSLFTYRQDDVTHAIRVLSVFPNGPAAKGGLMVGDVLTAVNGQQVSGMTLSQIADLTNNPKVEFVVTRPGGDVTLDLQPAKYADLISTAGR